MKNLEKKIKKGILFFLAHLIIFFTILFLIVFMLNIIFPDNNSIYGNVLVKSFLDLFDSIFGRMVMFFGGIVYIISAVSYEVITDSFSYYSTKKFYYLLKILFGVLLIALVGTYFLWITKFI